MPGEWYNQAEAALLLNGLSSGDVFISEEGSSFIWSISRSLEMRLEGIRTKTVDKQVGYSLADATNYTEEDRWFNEEESQASISERLRLRFGDPNILRGYGLETANKLWKKDPNVIKRLVSQEAA